MRSSPFLWLLLCLLMAAPPRLAQAGGPPLPPGGLFQAPSTPTPAALPTATPTPAAPATPAPAIEDPLPDPGPTPPASQIFLPFLSRSGGFSPAGPEPEHPADPWAGSFAYTVQAGDTLSDLALEFGRDLSLLSCAFTAEGAPFAQASVGQMLILPARNDLCHRVKAGETLATIAAWYGVEENRLQAGEALKPGRYLLIPDARSRYRAAGDAASRPPAFSGWRYGDGVFAWPLAADVAWISQGFRHGQHMAIDLAAPAGTEVLAADTGRVIKAGWNENGYGYRVVIDHGIDYVTLYAHLGEYYVQEGDVVTQGQAIGAVGSTGNSTGPHLHFEVRDFGYLIDPLLVLPPWE